MYNAGTVVLRLRDTVDIHLFIYDIHAITNLSSV